MRAVLALALMVSPLSAQDLIDYDLLLRQHADRVTVTTDGSGKQRRTLEMPGAVIVSCSDDGCTGMDMGASGAVGCVWSLAMALRAVAEVCTMPEAAELATIHDRLSAFAARNAVPPREAAELDGYYADLLRQYRDGGDTGGPLACDTLAAPGSNVQAMIKALVAPPSSGGEGFDLEALLATPRLPVMNPCL